jgi:hypothetical protein
MYTELLPPGGYPIAVKYIISNSTVITVTAENFAFSGLIPIHSWHVENKWGWL